MSQDTVYIDGESLTLRDVMAVARAVSPFVERDRELEEDIYAVAEMVHLGVLLDAVKLEEDEGSDDNA
jgi:hypothetical protein